ncbi:hypothetical protein Poly51_48780 [Rubripirellula tenax]|uniref:Uncharacterized protein n=1 Tax=Rubripirellula tenax TaxID=2528015 RepID=A0A5C6EKF4_9BACT|nr:hypothetical protein [Rubripirellula tenax]TWU48974.1 hypothetical protein Poly51_48780 [Rubripirellula tenax]
MSLSPPPAEPYRSPTEENAFVNPYDPPSQSATQRQKSTPFFVAASLAAFIGFVVAGPGLVYVTSDMNRRMASGRRYATYDPELYLFGVSITPTTAQVLTFGVAPLLIAFSVFLFFRGARNRRLNVDSVTDTA